MGDRVALVAARRALKGRAVEPDALLKSLLELADRDGEALEQPQDIDEHRRTKRTPRSSTVRIA